MITTPAQNETYALIVCMDKPQHDPTHIEVLGEGGPRLAPILAHDNGFGNGFRGRVRFQSVDVTVPTHL